MSDGSDCFAFDQGMISVADALERLRRDTRRVAGTERVPLRIAGGRILAEPLEAPRDVPAFNNVAVDGYAFAAESLRADAPTALPVMRERVAAGHVPATRVPAGHAVRVLTGAMLPGGTDTVAMEEEVELADDRVVIPAGYPAGANVRRAGEDVSAGTVLFRAGTRLLPQHLGVAASLGLAELAVFRRLHVAVLSTGDELIEPGHPFVESGVFDANRYILQALLAALPVEVADLGILPDDEAAVRAALERAGQAFDAILTSGGASRGDEDHTVRCARELGSLQFWRVRMKPGRPLALGRIGRAAFVGLPGNPVAAMVGFLLFARPLLLCLAGGGWRQPRAFSVPADFAMRKKAGRSEFLRARLVPAEEGWRARRVERQGSGILTSMTEADGLVMLEEERTRVEPGDPVAFLGFAEFGYG